MKNYSLILISLLLLCACKARQVSAGKADMVKQTIKTEMQQNNVLHIDTGKSITHITGQKLRQDSMTIVIMPDTGIIHIINGNYTGKAHSIVIKRSSSLVQNTKQVVQQNKGEMIRSTLKDSVMQQSSEQAHTKTKQSSTTGISFLFYSIVCVLILGAIGLAKVKRWF